MVPAWDARSTPEEVISAIEAEKLSRPMYEKLYAIQQTATKIQMVLFLAILFFMVTKKFFSLSEIIPFA